MIIITFHDMYHLCRPRARDVVERSRVLPFEAPGTATTELSLSSGVELSAAAAV